LTGLDPVIHALAGQIKGMDMWIKSAQDGRNRFYELDTSSYRKKIFPVSPATGKVSLRGATAGI
jgi:hypothetical protein